MAVEEPEIVNVETPVVDSGIHVADPEDTPASGWQITLAAVLVVAILSVFFYGVSNQRLEVAGSTPSQQATNVPPAQTAPTKTASKQAAKPSTTGQAPHEDAPKPGNPPGAPRQQQPQKADSQNAAKPASAPQKNQ
jgi:hypothetical protein